MSPATLRTYGGMQPNDPTQAGFGSMHPGVVQFCFADGSVRGLKHGNSHWSGTGDFPPASSDWWVFQQLAGMHDGEVVNTSALQP